MLDNNNFTRDDIAESLHNEFGLTKKDCVIFVNDIIDIIIDGLETNGYVKIHNFGTFKLKQKNNSIKVIFFIIYILLIIMIILL